jgi:cytochrome c
MPLSPHDAKPAGFHHDHQECQGGAPSRYRTPAIICRGGNGAVSDQLDGTLGTDRAAVFRNRRALKPGNREIKAMKPLRDYRAKTSHPAFWTGLLMCAWSSAASAQIAPAAQRGTNFALANCVACHSIDKVTPSSLPLAPPFRTLHLRYPVESLAEALAEGIVTGHSNMPEFRLDPGQVGDFIAFLKTLER